MVELRQWETLPRTKNLPGNTVLCCPQVRLIPNEFRDDETLGLIPKCCHVFHPDCIDAWLVNQCTCPVCHANLAPKPEDAPSSVEIHVPDPARPIVPITEPIGPNDINQVEEEHAGEQNRIVTEPPRVLDYLNRIRSVWSKSTGIGIARLFSRSHSTSHSLIRQGEDCERFTLRLREEVKDRLVRSATLNRTKSCGVTWQLESSGRRGYRMRSVGKYKRFGGEGRLDWWGFMWTPPFWCRTGSVRSPTATRVKDVDVGERSSDRLFSKD